jgi:predicted phosphodiesterase
VLHAHNTRALTDAGVEGVYARTVVCGHTHMPFDRMVGSTRVANAGSVSMPRSPAFCRDPELGQVRAQHGHRAQLGHVQAVIEGARSVLEPPSEADVMARLTSASFR